MRSILKNIPNEDIKFLTIGEGGVYTSPVAVLTVLGSCVSVTFHADKKAVGGMFHAFLPTVNGSRRSSLDLGYRYVDEAIKMVHDSFRNLFVESGDIECKVFGGANTMFDETADIGRKNVEMAFAVLRELKLKVVSSDVGGNMGRKLLFLPHTGEVFLKKLHGRNSTAQPGGSIPS